MKKSIYKLILVLFLIPLVGFTSSTEPKYEKTKTLKKSYSVNKDATVKISNKYGNVNVVSWNQNRVEITVEITVKGNSTSAVEKKLAGIDVQFNGSENYVSAKTIIERNSSWSLWRNDSNISYQINYTVKMPITNNADLNNDYGSILVNELSGKASINCDYGKIIIGRLNSDDNTINIDYCSTSTISFMKSGKINADYSKLTVDDAIDLHVNADYSGLNFGKVNGIDFNNDYGSISVDKANNIAGNADYVSIRLGTIYRNLKLDSEYGSIKIKELARGFNRAVINADYTGISIGTNRNNNFHFIVEVSYAGFRFNERAVDLQKSIEKSTKKYFEGNYGSKKSNSVLSIKSEYGSVRLEEL